MATKTGRKMRATLVRFGPELYEELQAEAARSGVSIAQYVREAVVARMAYTAGRRGEPGWVPADERELARMTAKRTREESARVRQETQAVRAQGRQAASQARRVREQTTRSSS